jgi:D-glycero-alpha-D-manno-heptose-7-phosphate kinase
MLKMDEDFIEVVNAVAPTRICDCGGWTDTWFADHGKIFNIAVYPCAEVQLRVSRNPFEDGHRVLIHAENYGERYAPNLGGDGFDRHPLLEAAIKFVGIPDDLSFEVNIFSEMPAGCSVGTSAAVTVAMIAALDALTPSYMCAHEIALAAQRVETEMLGQQCGIQDQLCSAYGGICFMDMYKYPYASVSKISVPQDFRCELERRLALIYLGKTHSSSNVHRQVIEHLEKGKDAQSLLEPLRKAAESAKAAVTRCDFNGLGEAMMLNTQAQEMLHPKLVSDRAWEVIEIAKSHGVQGVKVNGAGGEGGSLTILCGESSHRKREMIKDIEDRIPSCVAIPIYINEYGVRVWRS